ncbi:L-2-hydroxyglutarate dehydrogenase, mitochondrial [Seminavis robusta]|uniref:L-2-hydroxyglutarate dehydrogenase, mitochondrial n=1 Tax=Seminavis robusta TaxID=568900 RepID=A0A9N8EVY7_9STRA|nr:L-2-hydroxyglutarate dehydrogenase, mitochondrial [Seminavis robusta]|eukprot:Sro1923_g305640.1 L-2-hydroxyglutarate dehydrogenase, mitochondrial (328) ;mRNA; f:3314-4384
MAAVPSAAFQVEAAVIGAGVIGLALQKLGHGRQGSDYSGSSGDYWLWWVLFIPLYLVMIVIVSFYVTFTSPLTYCMSCYMVKIRDIISKLEVIHLDSISTSISQARFCVGETTLYEYCQSRSIPYQKCGKLIVATQKEQLETKILDLQQKAVQNGVLDTRILTTKEDVQVLEPNIQAVGALWSPSTGVINSHSFMLSLLADAEDHGATLALHSKLNTDFTTTACSTGTGMDRRELAGLWAHQVAQSIHHYNNHNCCIPRQYFAKGNYFQLEGCNSSKNPFTHLVYPIPEPGGLGVHATMDWSGQSVKFGPDVEWIDVKPQQNRTALT